MGNILTQPIDYKTKIEHGISLINEWCDNQDEEMKQKDEYKELKQILSEIQNQNNYSKTSYENIRYFLRPFEEYIPLTIKRIFDIAMMDQYTMFIASRWFETIEDHINLIKTTRRFKLNMTKFHYNPISLNSITVKFFPNIETFHTYNGDDEYIEGGRIERYIDWRRYEYWNYLKQIKKNRVKKPIEFKRLNWTKYDFELCSKQCMKNDSLFQIPEGVYELINYNEPNFTFNINKISIP